jgi:hypothetical protein
LPNLTSVLAALTLFYCLFVFHAGTSLFRDPDAGWHIRNGERILSIDAPPRTDPFSFSKSGQPWIAWEWGADVLLGAAHRLDGLRAVTVLVALAIAACLWLSFRLHFAVGGDFFLVLLFAPLSVVISSLHWLARPHVLSWLFVLAALLYAERAPARFGFRHLALIAGATALWANLHASFMLAPAIALAYATGHLFRPLLWPLDRDSEWRRARWFLCAAFAALAGTLVNPYGWRLHAHVISFLTDTSLTAHIQEFQPFHLHQPNSAPAALAIGLAAAGGVLALFQKKVAHFLIATALVVGALRVGRFVPLVALAAFPLANGAFSEALHRLASARWFAVFSRLRTREGGWSGAAFLAIAASATVIAFYSLANIQEIGFPANRFPVRAAQVVEKLPEDARLLTNDTFGSYLIYRFAGARKIFVDGRSDFYGREFMEQYLVVMQALPGWWEIARPFASPTPSFPPARSF